MSSKQRSLFFDTPITDADVIAVFENADTVLTRKQIASRVDRVKTPALIARIERLVGEGRLERAASTMPNGSTCFYYRWGNAEVDNHHE